MSVSTRFLPPGSPTMMAGAARAMAVSPNEAASIETGVMAGPGTSGMARGRSRSTSQAVPVDTPAELPNVSARKRKIEDAIKGASPRLQALWETQNARELAAIRWANGDEPPPAGREIIAALRTGYVTPYKGAKITGVQGIVTHVKKSGFTLHIPTELSGKPPVDIYVYTGDGRRKNDPEDAPDNGPRQRFKPGMQLKLQHSTVSPFKSQSEWDRDSLDSPQLYCPLDDIVIETENRALPEPEIYGEGGFVPAKEIMDAETLRFMHETLNTDRLDAPGVPFDPEKQAHAGFRSRLYKRMVIKDALVVAASDDRKYFYVVPNGGKHVTHLSPEGAAVYTEDNYPTEPIKIDVAALPPEARHMVTVGDRIKGDLVGVLEASYGDYQLRLTEGFEVTRGGLKPQIAKRIDDRATRMVTGSRNIENFSILNAERMEKLIFNFVVRSLAPDFEGWEELQDDSGPKNDGTVSPEKTMTAFCEGANALLKKIKSGDVSDLKEAGLTDQEIADVLASLPAKADYDYAQIDPVDGGNGGQPGGNIRPVVVFNKARVNFDRRGNAKHDTEVEVVDAPDGGPMLNHNPGLVAPNSDPFKGSRKPLAVEVEFNGEKIFFIVNHLMSKRGDSDPWGVYQPYHTPSAVKRAEQVEELMEFIKQIHAKDPKAKIIVVGDMNEFHFNKPMQDMVEDGVLIHMPSALLEGAQILSYVHAGRGQALDQAFASAAIMALSPTIQFLHQNAFFPSVRERVPTSGDGDAGGRPSKKTGGKKAPIVLEGVPAGVFIQISDHDPFQVTVKIK